MKLYSMVLSVAVISFMVYAMIGKYEAEASPKQTVSYVIADHMQAINNAVR